MATDAPHAEIGIIGGTGLYDLPGLEQREEVKLTTPYGEPGDALVTGVLSGCRVVFVPRHGRGHRLMPHEIPARANLYALKMMGVERVVSVSAVGSLREELEPGHVVVPDQIFDRTRGTRPSSFFGDGLVVHVSLADPYCPQLRGELVGAARRAAGTAVHDSGTYVCMEGPQFSTRAESRLYRQWGLGIIGMTALPEAKLAREAELCYATLALVTDYDCWREGGEDVTAEMVSEVLSRNAAAAQRTLTALLESLPSARECPCGSALEGAIVTAPDVVPQETRDRTRLLIGRYMDWDDEPGTPG